MMRTAFRFVLPVLALFSASTALAQDDPDAWALSGGFDLIELREGEGAAAFTWDGTFSLGNATDQVMLDTTGGGALDSQIDEIDLRLLYGRTVGNVTLLAGVRQNLSPGLRDTYAAVGAQGVIAERLSWETFIFFSQQGHVIGEGELVYQLPITDKLYLEPRVTLGWSADSVAEEATRPGFTEGEATVRLRYSVNDRINIYAGVLHERLLGGTRALALEQGDAAQSTIALVGFGLTL